MSLVSCWFLSFWNADFSCFRTTETWGKLNLHRLLSNVMLLLRPRVLALERILLKYFLNSFWCFCSIHFWMGSGCLKSFALTGCCLPVPSRQWSANPQPFLPWHCHSYLSFSLLEHMIQHFTEIMPCHVLKFSAFPTVFPTVINFQKQAKFQSHHVNFPCSTARSQKSSGTLEFLKISRPHFTKVPAFPLPLKIYCLTWVK